LLGLLSWLVLILLRLLRLGHEVLHPAQDNENQQQGNQQSLVCARFTLRIAIFGQWLILNFLVASL
jgi:hypothetical protein